MITTKEDLGDSAEEFEKEYRKAITKVLKRANIPVVMHRELLESEVSKFMNTQHSYEEIVQANEELNSMREKSVRIVESKFIL